MAVDRNAGYGGVEFINDAERLYFEEARFGETVRAFLASDVGRYLHGRASKQRYDALEALATAKPEDVVELQRSAAQGLAFMKWLAEAIANGDAAFQQLETYRDE